jgi:hypothetical protein
VAPIDDPELSPSLTCAQVHEFACASVSQAGGSNGLQCLARSLQRMGYGARVVSAPVWRNLSHNFVVVRIGALLRGQLPSAHPAWAVLLPLRLSCSPLPARTLPP